MFVGVEAHIDPAGCTDFTEISGEFDGTQWGDVGIAPYEKEGLAMCSIAPYEKEGGRCAQSPPTYILIIHGGT